MFGIYTPSIIGWFWVGLLIPLTILSYFISIIYQFKIKKFKRIVYNSLLLFIVILISIIYWYYNAKKLGNI